MLARRSKRCAVGRAFFVLGWIASVFCARGIAQQLLPAATERPNAQITALAERLGSQLLAANKKKPFILDLTLPNEIPCPLGAWLADRVSESLAQAYPELEVIPRSRWSSPRVPAGFARGDIPDFAQNQHPPQPLAPDARVSVNFPA